MLMWCNIIRNVYLYGVILFIFTFFTQMHGILSHNETDSADSKTHQILLGTFPKSKIYCFNSILTIHFRSKIVF